MNKQVTKILVPKQRFPEFQDAEEWVKQPLGKVAEIITGNTPSTTESSNYVGNKMFVSPADISEDRYITHTKTTLSEKGYSQTRHVKENSVLFVCIGSTIGKVAQNKFECATNQQINSIVPYEGYSSDFIYSTLENDSSRIASIAGIHVIPIINKSVFSSVLVSFPSPEEQQKIADCLSSIDDLISAQNQKLDALKDHKRGLMQQLFPADGETLPKLRFPEFWEAEEWEETTLIQIAKFRRGSFPQPYGLPEWYDDANGMPFIQVFDVGDDLRLKPKTKSKISKLASEQSVYIPKGTVIITIQGSIGRVAITQYDAYIDRTLLLFEEFFKPIEKTFFAYVLQLLFEIEKQNAPGGIIKTITKEVLSQFNIKIPQIGEQEKIAGCFLSIDKLITAQSKKLDALKAHKKGLMQQLFPTLNGINI